MNRIGQFIRTVTILLAVWLTSNISNATVWDISNNNDAAAIDDSGISTESNYPFGITDWVIRYGPEDTDIYKPMFREWFWYRIGDTGKQTSFDKLPVSVSNNAESGTVTLTYTDDQSRFKAIATFQVVGTPEYDFNSTINKNITIQNTTQSDLDFHLYSYNDLDLSEDGTTDNIAIKGARAIQTGRNGRTLIQTSTLTPSYFDIDNLGSNPGSSLDSLENGEEPLVLNDFSGPFPEDADMQFVFQYDLKIPAGESTSFVITDNIVLTNPLVISNAQTGGSCANNNGNVTYDICFNNTTNTFGANNVVVTATFNKDVADPFGTFSFISATDGGIHDPVKNTIGWTFPTMASEAQQCVQATVGVNTTKAFTVKATIYSDDTFPAQVSVTTPLCKNQVPSAPEQQTADAVINETFSYQIQATDPEFQELKFTTTDILPAGLTMSSSGFLSGTPSAIGTYSINVSIADMFNETIATRLIINVTSVAPPPPPVITKKIPAITWATPAAINYGTALSETQLNATANVPGSFTYSPSAGAVLAAGNRALSVVFTPADSVNYAVQNTSVSLIVLQSVLPPTTFSVTPARNGNGSTITPASVQTVNTGATASFTVSADEGYGILSVTGCGGTLNNNVYTTAAVTGNCGVLVTAVRRNGNGGGSDTPIMADALKALQWAIGALQLTDVEKIRYDVAPLNTNGNPQGNGVVDFADVILILRKTIGIGSW